MPVVESKAADVFAFAMVAVEVFTGEVPFPGEPFAVVPSLVLKGGRPEMPQGAEQIGLTDEIWEFLERCWHQNPKKRPTMGEVARRWQRFVDSENDGVVDNARIFYLPVFAPFDRLRRTPPTTGLSHPQPSAAGCQSEKHAGAVEHEKKRFLGLF